MSKIRIGIVGYGNLGKGAELSLLQNPDMTLAAIFTRRDPLTIDPVSKNVPVYPATDAVKFKDDIDIMILCGGSATDLITQGPEFAKMFHTIDSFDTHARIPEYFERMDQVCRQSRHASIISVGWDPGLFSLSRLYFRSVLPEGKDFTFWGRGVSQGHSDAVRRIPGVEDAVQYTVPSHEAVEKARSCNLSVYDSVKQHKRECYVVAKEGANTKEIAEAVVSMPNYFADYETSVHFISKEELKKNHSTMPHGGSVIRTGKSANQINQHMLDFTLRLDSNPEFTSSVLVAYARALHRLVSEGFTGAATVLDIPPAYISPLSGGQLRKELL